MEEQSMVSWGRAKALIRKIKSHPILTIFGILATIVGLVKGIPPALDAITEIVGIPKCFTYSDIYYYSGGNFKKYSPSDWEESGATRFSFTEVHRNRDFILLLNITPRVPRQSGDNKMLLRLPVCGGTAQWSYQNPAGWIDLYEIWR